MCEDMITAKLDQRWVSAHVPADCIRSVEVSSRSSPTNRFLETSEWTVFRWRLVGSPSGTI
jgi:hypothetical protein